MHAVLQALRDLQGVDRDLFLVQTELKRLPVERATRKLELDRLTAKVAEKRTEQKTLRVRVKEYEDHATVQRQRARKVENEMSASRADMALIAAYQHELKTLKRDIGDAEDSGLALLEKIEGLEAEAQALQKKLDEDQKVFAEFSANVEREMAEAEARRASLSAERQRRMSAQIPPEALAEYTKLLGAREGVALALLEGRTCQACFMEIPTNLCVRVSRGSELVKCPSCDRILYLAQ